MLTRSHNTRVDIPRGELETKTPAVTVTAGCWWLVYKLRHVIVTPTGSLFHKDFPFPLPFLFFACIHLRETHHLAAR